MPGFLDKIFGGGVSQIVDSVTNAADKFITTSQEKEEFKLKVQEEVNRSVEALAVNAKAELEIVMKDNDSARNREVSIATSDKAPYLTKIIVPLMALLTISLTFLFFYMILFKKTGSGIDRDILIYILGSLTTITVQVYSYYFGSSASSARKQTMIEKDANQMKPYTTCRLKYIIAGIIIGILLSLLF